MHDTEPLARLDGLEGLAGGLGQKSGIALWDVLTLRCQLASGNVKRQLDARVWAQEREKDRESESKSERERDLEPSAFRGPSELRDGMKSQQQNSNKNPKAQGWTFKSLMLKADWHKEEKCYKNFSCTNCLP